MTAFNSMFKFATIRNASNEAKTDPKFEIQPRTPVTGTLVTILAGDQKQPDIIKAFNECLSNFISSKNFYKVKAEITAMAAPLFNAKPAGKAEILKNLAEIKAFADTLYTNIVVRAATKSTGNEVFKLLTDTLKTAWQKLNPDAVRAQDAAKLKILLPEGLIISFAPQQTVAASGTGGSTDSTTLLTALSELQKQKIQVINSRAETALQIDLEQQRIKNLPDNTITAQPPAQASAATQAAAGTLALSATAMAPLPAGPGGVAAPENIKFITGSSPALERLTATDVSLGKIETDLSAKLTALNQQAFQLIPQKQYVAIGSTFIDVSRFITKPPVVEKDAILVYTGGCYLKFPFQIADLRVVEQKTVGYLPNEIAHINNTQSGERQEKVTRRLKRIETFDSFITEDEVSKETDTQSTEKFTLEKAAADVQTEENSVNVNARVSGTYGVVTASVDAGFSHKESSQSSNSASQSYAKEIVQKVVDRVTHKVKSERSIKSLEEFEETVTHIIDNTKEGPKSYVYRWLTKLVRATLKNYGKRLMFQVDVAHPSSYYLTRIIKESIPLNIPPDPRLLKKTSTDPAIAEFYKKNPLFPYSFVIDDITPGNYLAWAELYRTKLEQPQAEKVFIGISELKDQVVKITDGYYASKAHIKYVLKKDNGAAGGFAFFDALLGRQSVIRWLVPGTDSVVDVYDVRNLDNETNELPVAFFSPFNGGLKATIEIECILTNRTLRAWQTKCYFGIIEAYENLKREAESKMNEFNPNNPGLNPLKKAELIKTELKKGALRKMFRCNPFWITDQYEVGQEYDPNCCEDTLNAEKIRFLETTFDWQNMTYELYPYIYADKDNWSDLLNLSDDDPHFEAFLQSSYATVRIPVFRDTDKEIAAVNFILNNSIANHSVLPAGMQHIIDDLKVNTPFGYIDETKTAIPFVSIIREYDRAGNLKFYHLDAAGKEVICKEVVEYDKEGKQTRFYYNAATGKMVISEIKEGMNEEGQQYSYYFNSANEKILTRKTKTEYDISGGSLPCYSTGLGIFEIPTSLVILEAGVQDGIEVRGYPEDAAAPATDVIIPKKYSPAIIKK